MKKSPCAAMIAVTLGLTGCIVTSVYPFYTAKDVAFDPSLLGGWTNVETAGETWRLESGGINFHQLTTTSNAGKTSSGCWRAIPSAFAARLRIIGSLSFKRPNKG